MLAYAQGGEPSLAPYEGGWVAMFPGDSILRVFDRLGAPVGEVPLTSRNRVGVPADLVERVARVAQSDTFAYSASLALAIRRMSDGTYLLVHVDPVVEPNVDPNRPITFSRLHYWVSVVTSGLDRACVDGSVPVESDNLILPFFAGDTLAFVTRRVGGDDRLRSTLHRFLVSTDRCSWVSTGGVRPSPR